MPYRLPIGTDERMADINKRWRDWRERYTGEKLVDTPFGPAMQQPDLLRKAVVAGAEQLMGGEPGTVEQANNLLFSMAMPIAYHGSPYKFDSFAKEKIGTGQGAQTYGHGLYFAEEPKVALEYKGQLGGTPAAGEARVFLRGKELERGIPGGGNPEYHAATLVNDVGVKEARKLATQWVNEPVVGEAIDYYKSVRDAVFGIKNKGEVAIKRGYLYKSDILPPAEKFLDWDKPLSQQHPDVQKALKVLGYEPPKGAAEPYGKDIYDAISRTFKTQENVHTSSPQFASWRLSEAGIPGIRYLDQGSRQAVKGVTKETFDSLSKLQRGEPEKAMLNVQRVNTGVMSPMVEKVGDLTHRMTELPTFETGGYEFVKNKVDYSLAALRHKYGFEREFEQNIINNAKFRNIPEASLRRNVYDSLQKYADAHRQLPVYNEAQRAARDAAVAIGERKYDLARKNLEILESHLKTKDDWVKFAHQGLDKRTYNYVVFNDKDVKILERK